MELRPIDVNVISAANLKNVNTITKMDVYVIGSVSGDPRSIQRTPIDKDAGTSPKWNHPMNFVVEEEAARHDRIGFLFQLMSDRALGDKEIGRVYIRLKDLMDKYEEKGDGEGGGEGIRVERGVQTPSGKVKGTLLFSYKFSGKLTSQIKGPPPVPTTFGVRPSSGSGAKAAHPPPDMAVPYAAPVGSPGAAAAVSYPYSGGYVPPPPQGYPYYQPPGYPPAPGFGYPPAPGYGYPGPMPGPYGYTQPGYGVAPTMAPPKKGSRFGLGLGAGLLGGMLLGEMVEDAAEDAAYDAMYDY